MTDDQLELVNAYLDGEATADERAVVESDPELLTEVERMRSVRNALSDVEQPSATSRESAIAAALAAFDELPAVPGDGHAVPPPPIDATAPTNIVPFERRRRMRRLQGLSAAAAAIVIVAGGIAISQRDDDGGSSADVERESTPLVEAPAQEQDSDSTVAMETTSTTIAPVMAVVPTTSGYEAAEVADEADNGATAGALTTEPAADMAVPAPAPADILATLVVLRDEDELADFAATMKEAPLAADDAESQCDDATLKADASYQDADGAEHPIVVVVIDEDAEQLGALSLDDCEIVLQVD